MEKPDCYECKHMGRIPGDAHICCRHPAFRKAMENPMAQFISEMSSVGRMPPIIAPGEGGIVVKGDPHGIRNGWFNHPFNFCPVWLLECNGFEKREMK